MIYLPTMVTSHGVKKLPQGSNFALGELPVELPPLGFGFHLWIGPKKNMGTAELYTEPPLLGLLQRVSRQCRRPGSCEFGQDGQVGCQS